MPLTPVEIRHIELKGGLFGYRKRAVHLVLDDVADSFEVVWRDRARLVERVEEVETEVTRHVELEGLLRSTLISAERASQDMKESARREADVIVTEANAEARKILRDAITQKQALMADVRRIQALLRSSLEIVGRRTSQSQALRSRANDRTNRSGVPRPVTRVAHRLSSRLSCDLTTACKAIALHLHSHTQRRRHDWRSPLAHPKDVPVVLARVRDSCLR